MFGRRRHRDGEVITASEALVEGRYAEHLAGRRCAVPVWAWTNLLAHATDDQLRHAASVRPTGRCDGQACGATPVPTSPARSSMLPPAAALSGRCRPRRWCRSSSTSWPDQRPTSPRPLSGSPASSPRCQSTGHGTRTPDIGGRPSCGRALRLGTDPAPGRLGCSPETWRRLMVTSSIVKADDHAARPRRGRRSRAVP